MAVAMSMQLISMEARDLHVSGAELDAERRRKFSPDQTMGILDSYRLPAVEVTPAVLAAGGFPFRGRH